LSLLVLIGTVHPFRGYFKVFFPGIGTPLQAAAMTGGAEKHGQKQNANGQTRSLKKTWAKQAGGLQRRLDMRVSELVHFLESESTRTEVV